MIRICYPNLRIDAVTFGLLIVALLPWFAELIESAKFPGGWEVTFRDIREAGAKVTASAPPEKDVRRPKREHLSFVTVAEQDPNLAVVALRIEIEKKIRQLARNQKLNESVSLSQLLQELMRHEALPGEMASGLKELISAGNQAAHGARVEKRVADWAVEVGPEILSSLDELIEDENSKR